MKTGGINAHPSLVGRLSLPIVLVLIYLIQMTNTNGLGAVAPNFVALDSGIGMLYKHPWSLLTYGFIHASVAHLVTTSLLLMYLVFFFHQPSTYSIWGQFVVGTLVGGLLFLCFTPGRVPDGSTLVGASAGVCALVPTSIDFLLRQLRKGEALRLFKLLPLVLILILDIFALYHQTNWGILAHLGGYLGGGLWVLVGFLLRQKEAKRQGHALEVMRQSVIEKVNRSGYASLTDDERKMMGVVDNNKVNKP